MEDTEPTTREEAYGNAYRELREGRLYTNYMTPMKAARFLTAQMKDHLDTQTRRRIRADVRDKMNQALTT